MTIKAVACSSHYTQPITCIILLKVDYSNQATALMVIISFELLKSDLPSRYYANYGITHAITPKHVTSGGTYLRGLALGQHSSIETSR